MLMVIFACKDWSMVNTISKKQKAPKGYVIDPTKREFLLRTPEQLMKMELLLLVQ